MNRLFQFLKPLRLPIATVLTLVAIRVLSDLYLPTLTADIVNNGIVLGNTRHIIQVIHNHSGLGALPIAASCNRPGLPQPLPGIAEKVFSGGSPPEFDKLDPILINRTTNDVTQLQMVLLFDCA